MTQTFWQRLIQAFEESDKANVELLEAQAEQQTMSRPTWISGDQTVFKVPILDLTEQVGAVHSVINNDEVLERLKSWSTKTLEDVQAELAESDAELDLEIDVDFKLPCDEALKPGLVSAPKIQDDKWVAYWTGTQLLFLRSWSGELRVIADAAKQDNELHVTKIQCLDGGIIDFFELDAAVGFEWFIRHVCLQEWFPLPAGRELADYFEREPLTGFSAFGPLLLGLTAEKYEFPEPRKVLHSRSSAVIAVIQDDIESLKSMPLAEIQRKDPENGYSPAHFAVLYDRPECLKALKQAADDSSDVLDYGDDRGLTPLALALLGKRSEATISTLIDCGVDIAQSNTAGNTLLHVIATVGYSEILPKFAALDPNQANPDGFTALHIAVLEEDAEMVKALLEQGADPAIKSEHGSAIELAAKIENAEILKLLDSDSE